MDQSCNGIRWVLLKNAFELEKFYGYRYVLNIAYMNINILHNGNVTFGFC